MVHFDRRWLPLNALRAFESVGQLLSFTLAANALQVSQAAVSRHVINLEDLIGQKLLDRRAQSVALTPAGAALLPVLQQSFDHMEHVLNEIAKGLDKNQSIRLYLFPAFAQKYSSMIIHNFHHQFRERSLIFSTTAPRIGIISDVDVAVVCSRPELVADPSGLLWMSSVTPLCSPSFAMKCREIGLTRTLCESQLVDVKQDGNSQGANWSAFAKRCGVEISAENTVVFDSPVLAAKYAEEVEALVLLDPRLYSDDLAAGRLAAPFRHRMEDGLGYFVVTSPENYSNPVINAASAWLLNEFATPKLTGLSA